MPVAILGSHKVRNWKRGRFPRVLVTYGTPIVYERVRASTRDQQQLVADEVLRRIRALHDELGERGGEPVPSASPSPAT